MAALSPHFSTRLVSEGEGSENRAAEAELDKDRRVRGCAQAHAGAGYAVKPGAVRPLCSGTHGRILTVLDIVIARPGWPTSPDPRAIKALN